MEKSKTTIQHITADESANNLVESLVRQYRVLMESAVTTNLDEDLVKALTQEGIIF